MSTLYANTCKLQQTNRKKKIFYCFYYLKVFLNIRHVYVALNTTNTTNTTKYNIVHFKKIKSAMN